MRSKRIHLGPASALPVAALALLAAICPPVAATAGGATELSAAGKPRIGVWPIPFGAERRREMVAYSQRHYGERTWRLRRPRVIVEHMAIAGSAAAVHNAFAPDVADPELGATAKRSQTESLKGGR